MSENLFSAVFDMEHILFGNADRAAIRADVRRCVLEKCVPAGPKFLLFKITNYCNSDCMYCSHAISNQEEKKSDIPLETILQIIKDAGSMHMTACSISGGEPLVRDDIEIIVRAFCEQGILPVLLTNGLLLPKRWESLAEAGLRYVIISVDSIIPEIYEKQRGVKFERAMAGIEAALAMKERYPDTHIHVTTVLTKHNAHQLPDFINYMSERGIFTQISPYHQFNPTVPNLNRIDDPETAYTLAGQLLRMKREGSLIANSEAFLAHLPNFFLHDMRMPADFKCLCGYTNMHIDAYGEVHCCWDGTFKTLGNVREQSICDIWNSPEYQPVRERMLKNQCAGCWYLCTAEITNFLMDPEM